MGANGGQSGIVGEPGVVGQDGEQSQTRQRAGLRVAWSGSDPLGDNASTTRAALTEYAVTNGM